MRYIYTFYATLFFSLTLLLVFPIYYFIFIFYSKSAPRIAHRFTHLYARVALKGMGVRLEVLGKEKLNSNSTYVFISNHLSLLDIPAFALSCNHTFRFLAKEELTRVPVMGFIIRKLYISVNRKSKEDRLRSKQRMMASIKEGISVFICPEGTRNTSQATLLEFKDGAFQLAIDAQVPIAVLTIHGSSKLLSPIGFLFHPGKIKAIWAGTIDTKGMNSNDLPRLKAQAREMMLKDLLHSDRL